MTWFRSLTRSCPSGSCACRSAPATRATAGRPPCAGCSACPGRPTATALASRESAERKRPPMSKPIKQVHLAAHFPGVNNTTVWRDRAGGSHIEFDSFRRFAQSAERGKFDFMFLAEGLRLREQNAQIYDLDGGGRPDPFTPLAALAAVTEHRGLTGTITSPFTAPYEVARQF